MSGTNSNGAANERLPGLRSRVFSFLRFSTFARALDWVVFAGVVLALVLAPLDYSSDDLPQITRLTLLLFVLLFLWSLEWAVAGRMRFSWSSLHLVLLVFLAYGLIQLLPLPLALGKLLASSARPAALHSVVESFGPRRAGSVSLHLSVDPVSTARSVALLAMLVGYFFLASAFMTSEKRMRLAIYALFACNFFIALIGTRNRVVPDSQVIWHFASGAPFGSFVNRAHFSGFTEMILPFALALIFARAIRRERYVLPAFLAIFLGSTVIISGSRGGILVLILQLIYLPLLASQQKALLEGRNLVWRERIWQIMGASVIIIGVVGGVYWIGTEPVIHEVSARFETIEHDFRLGENYTRPELWRSSLKMIRDNPLLGVGLGAFRTAYPRYDNLSGLFEVQKAHNDYLQLVAETGAVGAVLGVVFLIVVTRKSLQGLTHPSPFCRAVALGANAALFGLLVHSLVDFNLQVTSNALLFLFIVSLIVVTSSDKESQEGTEA